MKRNCLFVPIFLILVLLTSSCSSLFEDESSSSDNSKYLTIFNQSSSSLPTGIYSSGSTSYTEEDTTYNVSGLDIYSIWSGYTPNTSSRDISSDAPEVTSLTFSDTVYVNLTSLQASADNTNWTSLSDSDSFELLSNITVSISDKVLTIDSSNYKKNLKIDITGTAEKGAVFFTPNKNYSIQLYIHDATITSSGNYPCLSIDKKSPVYLVLEGTNTFTDGRTYGTGYSTEEGSDYYTSSFTGTIASDAELTSTWAKGADTKGSVFAKGPILIDGTGSLTISENYKHAIYSKDYIKLFETFSGTVTVNSTGRNGIQSVNGFIMDSGTVSITGTGTHTNNQSRGIIVEGAEDSDYPGEGFIIINGGTIDITTVSKAISAKWDIDDDAETSSTSDDPYPYVLINGGKVTVQTTGTPKDESSSYTSFKDADGVTVSEKTKLSPEGIEGKQALFITGGIVELYTTDDCLNASREDSTNGAKVVITGGNIYAFSSSNDAIDSNGTLSIEGGIIVAGTNTTPECAFDCDSNTFSITGGLFVGIGTNNYSAPTPSSCTQSTFVLSGDYFGAGATSFSIENSSGTPVFAYTLPSTYGSSASSSYIMILSSPLLSTGISYKTVSGVTLGSGGKMFHNLYINLPDISGGSTTISSASTTSSNCVYTKVSQTNNGPQEGAHP